MYLSKELRRGLSILLLIGAFFAADFFGLFSRLNDIFYDQFTLATPGPKEKSQVLIIEAPANLRGAYGEATWRHILTEARSKGAKKVVFTFYPNVSREFYVEAKAKGDVLFGRAVIPSTFDPDKKVFEKVPAAAAGLSLPSGAWILPSSHSATYHEQYLSVDVNGKAQDSLTTATLKSLKSGVTIPKGETFMLNFTGGVDRAPVISIELANSGGLIDELVRGRTLVIGFGTPLGAPGLKIPGGRGAELSLVEYFGYGLDTLLTTGAPTNAQPWVTALLLVMVTLVPYLIRNLFDQGQFVVVNSIFAVAYVAALGLLFATLLVFSPVATTLLTHLVIVGLIGQWKAVDETQAVRTLVIESSVNLHKRVFPTSFVDVDEHWSHVISVVNQLLDLERVIFLERIPGDHRVREVIALNCSIEDINELRRDYERAPYSDAIAENGPCLVDKRIFMRPREDIVEAQYLVPLIFSGEMLGFWAFTIDTARIEVTPVFLSMVKDFTAQISELLYRRYYRQLSAEGTGLSLAKNPAHANIKELDRTISLLNRRLSQLEDVLDEISVATILYDLFGQVIQINQSMVALSEEVGVAPHNLTALDFIMTLTGIDLSKARRHLSEVVLNHRSVAFPITAGAAGESLTINIYPLLHREQERSGGEAFQIQGILCEIWDVSEIESIYQNRERAFKELLASVATVGKSLLTETAESRATGSKGEATLDTVMAKTREMVDMVERVEKKIVPDEEGRSFARAIPVDTHEALINAIKLAGHDLTAKKVTVSFDTPERRAMALAAPTALPEVMADILRALSHTANTSGEIEITSRGSSGQVNFSFFADGLGLSPERLQEMLYQPDTFGDGFAALGQDIETVRQWQGEMLVTSEVGHGITVNLSLEAIH
ncbi:MAG: HAMP domain-containing histidine kinase [Nitrospinae bacterium]|nr:HAMP domain-containing histidine kinase [Nitrospinota bacterium]